MCIRDRCEKNKCAYGKKLGLPIITPDGGTAEGNVLVSIEVEGARTFPSKLPSKPNFPETSFQNGVCTRKCAGKPTFPACLDQVHTRTHARTHAHTHARTHARACTHTHTHTACVCNKYPRTRKYKNTKRKIMTACLSS